jgi:hypothetical protein
MPKKRKGLKFGAESRMLGSASSYGPAGAGVAPGSAAAVPTMRKAELVLELRKRGMPVSGATEVLKERLLPILEAEEAAAKIRAEKMAERKAEKAQAKAEAKAVRAVEKAARHEERAARRAQKLAS